jgi:DNA replication and repair protein RecF
LIITSVRLLNFRNYVDEEVQFVKGLNVIEGPNGAGKTNIVEALHLASLGKSFRVTESKNLIKNGEEKARIILTLVKPTKNEIDITLKGNQKYILVNGKPLPKVSMLNEYLHTLVFSPSDITFFETSPLTRRDYLDEQISYFDKTYLDVRKDYEKIVKARNENLKSEQFDDKLHEVYTQKFVTLGLEITRKREIYIKKLENALSNSINEMTKKRIPLRLEYQNSLKSRSSEEENVKALLALKEREKVLGVSLKGPHRDDLVAFIGPNKVATHASQGQKRLLAIALKVAPYDLIENYHEKPVVILDDVLSELDKDHQEQLLDYIKKFKQVFITTTKYALNAHAIYEVKANHISRRIE